MNTSNPCSCGSGQTYEHCCGRYHHGSAAPTAEALMRSRYCAYVLQLVSYLRDTWHPSTRPSTLHFDGDEPRWCGLEIRDVSAGGAGDQEGVVEFVAHWLSSDAKCGALHERSRFVCEGGRWFYVDGTLYPSAIVKVGRNDPCPCGSGRKFKQCCGR